MRKNIELESPNARVRNSDAMTNLWPRKFLSPPDAGRVAENENRYESLYDGESHLSSNVAGVSSR